ncbi:hypothetical protein Goe20_01870 [Bacillus phage vB_BsuM-Goe20]|nr:hypothetical protein Goe20_01870 [Bacillus phage vB_BsuM-Goe20]
MNMKYNLKEEDFNMVEKVTIEITDEKAVVRLLDRKGEVINSSVRTLTDTGSIVKYEKDNFEYMDDNVLTTPLWEALEDNFFVHGVLTALANQ